jgi:hypothetical protein
LFNEYYNWINSTTDVQPGSSLNLDHFAVVGGKMGIPLWTNDVIVPIVDEEAIYGNINSTDKFYFVAFIPHLGMPEKGPVKEITKKILNEVYFDTLNSCHYLQNSTNSSRGCI